MERTSEKELSLEETYQTIEGEVEFERASTADPESRDQWEFNRLLRELLNELSPPYREAFILVKLEERNYEAAATMLGISPGLARIRVHRAIEKLRNHRQLKQYLEITTEEEEEE
jgi:RNA polymerase sigma factor (sigma-70 family)